MGTSLKRERGNTGPSTSVAGQTRALHSADKAAQQLQAGGFPCSRSPAVPMGCQSPAAAGRRISCSATPWPGSHHGGTQTCSAAPALPASQPSQLGAQPWAAPQPPGAALPLSPDPLSARAFCPETENAIVSGDRGLLSLIWCSGRCLRAYFQRFATRMANQVWSRLWCTTAPDRTWWSNTEEPTLPIDWIAVWPLLPLSQQDFCSSFCVQY